MDHRTERRQHPRVPVRDGLLCQLEVRARVHLVDISASGALLTADVSLPVGCHARLRSTIGNKAFGSAVEVRRQAKSARPDQPVALGATFTDMDEHSRRSLDEFLKKASA